MTPHPSSLGRSRTSYLQRTYLRQCHRRLQGCIDLLHQCIRQSTQDSVDPVLENRCEKKGADERALVKTAGLALGGRDVDENEGWIVGWCQVRRDLGDDDVHELRVIRVRLYYQCRALLSPRPARVREPGHHHVATAELHVPFPKRSSIATDSSRSRSVSTAVQGLSSYSPPERRLYTSGRSSTYSCPLSRTCTGWPSWSDLRCSCVSSIMSP